jgi:MerR family transcriptional regulator/heat shock protein HspR
MYERLGLVRPARIGRKNRVYSEADIERLRQIQRLTQDMGVNLAGVEVILDLLDKMQRMQEQMEAEMERMQQIMEERLRRLQK